MAQVPDAIRREIITVIYRRLDHLHWEQLGTAERSEHYAAFVNDPAIGGKLSPYKDESGIRVWIKDGPAKEYRRAIEGAGPYAEYTDRKLGGPNELVDQTLGRHWVVVQDSIVQKPMRCDVVNEDGNMCRVFWGPSSVFKELYWHASLAKIHLDKARIVVIVTKPSLAPLPENEWEMYGKLSSLLGITCYQATQNMTRK